jgi:hypothetical protein
VLDLSVQRVDVLLKEGRLRAVSVPLGRLVDPASVVAFDQAREQRRAAALASVDDA